METYSLPNLDYSYDSLEPAYSAEILDLDARIFFFG